MEGTIDAAFSYCMCNTKKQPKLRNIVTDKIDKFSKKTSNNDVIVSFEFAKELLSSIHKEWQESRKDDSNGEQ